MLHDLVVVFFGENLQLNAEFICTLAVFLIIVYILFNIFQFIKGVRAR